MSPNLNYEPLIELLGKQLEQYRKVLELAEQKRDCMVDGRIDDLEQTVRSETTALLQAGALEKKRLFATENLLQELGITNPQATLAELIAAAAEPAQATLAQLRDEFARLIQQLSAVNRHNRELLETNIAYTDMMLSLMLSSDDPLNNLYSGDGSTDNESIANPGLFDQQI